MTKTINGTIKISDEKMPVLSFITPEGKIWKNTKILGPTSINNLVALNENKILYSLIDLEAHNKPDKNKELAKNALNNIKNRLKKLNAEGEGEGEGEGGRGNSQSK